MSQHFLKNDKVGCFAQIGWDKPLQNFYCVITDKNEDVIFSNLDCDEFYGRDLSYYISKLSEFNFLIPIELEKEILEDKAHNIVGKTKNWF